MLAVAAGLRAVVAESGAEVVEPHGLRTAGHAVFQVGAADARRPLRLQRECAAAAILEGVHLLRDDVALRPGGVGEDAQLLDDRRLDAVVVEEPSDALSGVAHVAPDGLVLGQYVVHASWGLKVGHRLARPSARGMYVSSGKRARRP